MGAIPLMCDGLHLSPYMPVGLLLDIGKQVIMFANMNYNKHEIKIILLKPLK